MDSLPPIPTPASQRWREFRIRVMPAVFFLAVAVTTAMLWKQVAVPPMTAVGFVETNTAVVAAPMTGILAQMHVRRFQQVKAGEPICQVIIQDPKILPAQLAVIESEIQLVRISNEPLLGPARAYLQYYQLRVDLMKELASQATQEINWRAAEDDLTRAKSLFADKIIPETALQKAETKAQTLRTSILQRSNLLERLQTDLKNFALPEQAQNSTNPIQAAIAVHEAKLREIEAMASPRILYAPIDGMVSVVNRQSGETVVAGESLITISSVQSDQILAYVRQPLIFQPKAGMAVHVRARTPQRHTGDANVIQVGPQMEPYSTVMLPIASNHPQEWGLPISVSMPAGLPLVPGELVDIIFVTR